MKSYFDTSALIKLYYPETGRELVLTALKAGHECCISPLVWVELNSVLGRAVRAKKMTRAEQGEQIRRMLEDLSHFTMIHIEQGILEKAASLAASTGLRSLDSTHLACALTWRATKLISFDAELNEWAEAFKLGTIRL